MNENTQIAVPLYYEIYSQDLICDYIELKLLGTVRTIEEARTCCKLYREAIETSQSRGLPDLRSRVAVFFRPVLKGDKKRKNG